MVVSSQQSVASSPTAPNSGNGLNPLSLRAVLGLFEARTGFANKFLRRLALDNFCASIWMQCKAFLSNTAIISADSGLNPIRLSAVRGLFEARSEAVPPVLRASTAEYNEVMRQEANWYGWQSQTAELAGGRV